MIDMNDRSSSFEPLKLVVKKLDLPHNNIFKALDVLFREERFNAFPSLAVEVVRYRQMVGICAIVLLASFKSQFLLQERHAIESVALSASSPTIRPACGPCDIEFVVEIRVADG